MYFNFILNTFFCSKVGELRSPYDPLLNKRIICFFSLIINILKERRGRRGTLVPYLEGRLYFLADNNRGLGRI
jgi:hypothetical protein